MQNVRGFFIRQLNIQICIVRFLNPGIKFCPIQKPAQFVEFSHIDKFPLNQFLVFIVKFIFFLLSES